MKLATSYLAAMLVANKYEHNRKTISNWVSHILLFTWYCFYGFGSTLFKVSQVVQGVEGSRRNAPKQLLYFDDK